MDYNSFITNFQSPADLNELISFHRQGYGSNLEALLNDSQNGTNWTVPSYAKIGDIVFFMCAKSSVDYRHMAGIRKLARNTGDPAIISLANDQYDLHEKYAGKILAVGTVKNAPQKREAGSAYPGWGADIDSIVFLKQPVDINEFRSFITVSTRGAITKLDDTQYQALMRLIEKNNPGFLSDYMQQSQELPGMYDIIEGMTDEELEAGSKQSSTGPAPIYTTTTALRKRDPYLPEIVKRNANGVCQLCGNPAPFQDRKGKPYLEAHHILPLASNGPDHISNMVALCPNCHRKMHIVEDQADINKLTQVASSR